MLESRTPQVDTQIPAGLAPHFQEYDLASLEIIRDANLIIQRVLDYGNWDETRWLFKVYGKERIGEFVRQYGERWLHPVVFNYWRKLLNIRKWRHSPFLTQKSEVWPS